MPEINFGSALDEFQPKSTDVKLPAPSEIPYLTREESDRDWERRQNQSVWEASKEFIGGIDLDGYIKETWIPALKNESILKGLVTFDPDAYKALITSGKIGTKDLLMLGRIIGERAIEPDDLTDEQKKANHHARQNEMLQWNYGERQKEIAEGAGGKYQEDINAIADFADITAIAPSFGIFSQGYTSAFRKGIKGGAKATIPLTKAFTKGAEYTNKAFKIPEKIAGGKVYQFANAVGASAWAFGEGGALFTATAGLTIGKMASGFAEKVGRNAVEIQKVFSKPSSHERFLFRLSTDPNVSEKIRKLATKASKLHGTKLYDAVFDALVAGTSAGALQGALAYASGATAEQAGQGFGAGAGVGGSLGFAMSPFTKGGSGKNVGSVDAKGNLTARSEQGVRDYVSRKNSKFAEKEIRELAQVNPKSAVLLSTLDAVAPLEGLKLQIMDMDELGQTLGISPKDVPSAHYDRDTGLMVINSADMVNGVEEASHIFAHEVGHHFMKQRLGEDITTRRQVLESFEDEEGQEFYFLDDKGNKIDSIQPVRLNAEAVDFAKRYADRVRKTNPELADRMMRDAGLLGEELGAEAFAMSFSDDPNIFNQFKPQFRATLLTSMRKALSKFGLVDPKTGAPNAIMPEMQVPKPVQKMFKNYMAEARNLQIERSKEVEKGQKIFPKQGDTAQSSFQKQRGGLTWDMVTGNDFVLKDKVMSQEVADILTEGEVDLDKNYVGLGRDASNQNMNPKLREYLKKQSLRPEAVDSIINMIDKFIATREIVQIGHRSGGRNKHSDYNPYEIKDHTIFGYQFSPKKPTKSKHRKTGEERWSYPQLKVMTYNVDVVLSNVTAMAQAGLLKKFGDKPVENFLEALKEHSKNAYELYGQEKPINPKGVGENELFAMAFGATTLKADVLRQPDNKQFWTRADNGITDSIKSFPITALIGASGTGRSGFAVRYNNMKHNFLPSMSKGVDLRKMKQNIYDSSMIVRPPSKVVTEDRSPELRALAERFNRGEITADEYARGVEEFRPIETFTEEDIKPATIEEIIGALKENQVPKVGLGKNIPTGYPVGLRLDIDAYRKHNVWTPTIHENSKGSKKAIAHEPVAVITNARFGEDANMALGVAMGGAKSPFAVINGNWKKMNQGKVEALARTALNNKDGSWTQVGFDPTRHSYFYDRANHRVALDKADMVVQVGRAVFAKNAKTKDRSGGGKYFMPSNREEWVQKKFKAKAFQNFMNRRGKPKFAKKDKDGNYIPTIWYHGGRIGSKTPYMKGDGSPTLDQIADERIVPPQSAPDTDVWTPDTGTGKDRAKRPFFLSRNKKFSEEFQGDGLEPLEITTNVSKVWDYKNGKDVKKLLTAIRKKIKEDDWRQGYIARQGDRLEKNISEGNWKAIEVFRGEISDLGYDGFLVTEEFKGGMEENLAVFDASSVKMVADAKNYNSNPITPMNPERGKYPSLDVPTINRAKSVSGNFEGDTLYFPANKPSDLKKRAKKQGALGVAPLREQTLPSLPYAKRMAKQAYHKHFLSQNKKILNALGMNVEDITQTIGGWEDSEIGSMSRENSQRAVISYARAEDLKTAEALLGALAPEVQDAVISVTYAKGAKGREFVLDLMPEQAETLTSLEVMKKYNLVGDDSPVGGFTYDPTTNKLYLATNSADGANTISKFVSDFRSRGITGFTQRSAKIEFRSSKDYRRLLSKSRMHRLYGGDGWKKLHELADEARDRLGYDPVKEAKKVLRKKIKVQKGKSQFKKEGKVIAEHDALILPNNILTKGKNYVAKSLEKMNARGWNQILEANRIADALQSEMDDGGTSPENWAKIGSIRTQKNQPTEYAIPPATLHRWITQDGEFQKFFLEKVNEDPEYLQSALDGLASVMPNHEMARQGKVPTIMTALHAMWGVMSISAPPVAQESGWIALVNDKDTLNHLYDSIDGKFDLPLEDWEAHVSKFLRSVKNGGSMADILDKNGKPTGKKRPFAGNSVTMNANSMHKVLTEFNGRWGQLNDIINNGDLTGSQMRDEFFRQGFGGAYLGNKILSFVLATIARDDLVIIDRWQLINLWKDYLDAKTDGQPFRFEQDGTPVEKNNFYDSYVNLLSGTEGLAVFKSIEIAMNKLIEKNEAFLTEQLASHGLKPSIFALHWITWNMIKKEAVGHSSLDVTQKYLLEGRYPNEISQRQKFIEDFTGETKSTEEVVRKKTGGRARFKHSVEQGKNPYIRPI